MNLTRPVKSGPIHYPLGHQVKQVVITSLHEADPPFVGLGDRLETAYLLPCLMDKTY